MKAIDLTGQRFEMLQVLERSGKSKCGAIKWLCQCDCGNQTVTIGKDLRTGHTRSCGCKERMKHGLAFHNLYETWASIKQRITNPKHKSFKNYGGRGIQMYPEWLNDPVSFIDWIEANLGEKPEGFSLDRINNDEGYFPGNLRWADWSTQNHNKRNKGHETKEN